ncbi:MAG: DUF5050 domain-containing protein, partial [Clostridiaceae bacterium]
MRKINCLIITCTLIVSLFTGCSSRTPSGNNTEPDTSNNTSTEIEYGNTGSNIANQGLALQKGDWIYYVNYTNFSDSASLKLYKAKSDGTGKTKLNDEISRYINVIGDWIYYFGFELGKNNEVVSQGIYKIKTDGTEKSKMSDENCSSIIAAGEWLYYVRWTDFGELYKMKTDGTSKTKLCEVRSQNIFLS